MFIIIIIASSYVIAVLHRAFRILGHIRNVLDAHGDDIRQTISGLPIALANVNEMTVSLKETADQTNHAFGSLQNSLTDTVDDLRYGIETCVVYAKIIGEVYRAIFPKSS